MNLNEEEVYKLKSKIMTELVESLDMSSLGAELVTNVVVRIINDNAKTNSNQ